MQKKRKHIKDNNIKTATRGSFLNLVADTNIGLVTKKLKDKI